jgi:superfamily II DNA or RNA helicase
MEPDMIFPDQDSTNFPIGVKNNLNTILNDPKAGYTKKEFLRYHQFVIYKYMIKNPKIRGLLLYHEMGMGKSISAVALAEYYRKHDPDRNIVVLLSKSLQENFKKNISKYVKERVKDVAKSDDLESNLSDSQIDTIVDKKYKFVSLNASNMFTQMTRIDKTKEELLVEKQLQSFTDIVEKKDFLENTLLIIDEFHNLANSITNGSYNAIRLYDTIMNTKNIKLLFLTGTPIVNNPFELVPTFNMLRGLIPVDSRTSITLFPELKKDFDMYFVDAKTNKIKNSSRFQNRIFGMGSYYGSMYFGNKNKEDFPTELLTKIEKVPMSSEQFSKYNAVRDLEREESSVKGRVVRSERFSAKGDVSSSYRVKSRQISNYLIPEYALGPSRGKKARVKFIEKITSSDLHKTHIFSPKFGKILENIQKHKNQLGVFYSEFVSGEGIGVFARILELHGYISWQKNIKLKDDDSAFDIKFGVDDGVGGGGEKKLNSKFAIISGDISIEDRSKIVNVFNGDNNKHGEQIKLLLISKTGAEGLDLKNVRHIHICEPYWNMARVEQIIARGVRYKSHTTLPKSEHNVQPYVYLSDYPTGYNIKKKKEDTTDIDLFRKATKNKDLINQFLVSLAEASVDCSIHEKSFSAMVKKSIKCKLCSPNDKKLYHPILSKDLLLPNTCEELKTSEIQAKEIDVNGKKYYYSKGTEKNQFHIFKFDTEIQGYLPMGEHEPVYADIIRKLLKF